MRPNKCEKHQNYKYMNFCPFCKVLADRDTLEKERDALRALTQVKLGVGSGSGNLFVYGDYESVKAAQAIILERDALRARVDELETRPADKLIAEENVQLRAELEQIKRDWKNCDVMLACMKDGKRQQEVYSTSVEKERDKLRTERDDARENSNRFQMEVMQLRAALAALAKESHGWCGTKAMSEALENAEVLLNAK